MTGSRVSLRALAQALGVDEAAVRRGVQRGRLTARSIGRDEAGRPYVRDVEAARAEWRENASKLRAAKRLGAATRNEEAVRPLAPYSDVDTDTEAVVWGLLELVLRREGRRFVTRWEKGFPVEFDSRSLAEWLLQELERERRRDASRKHGE